MQKLLVTLVVITGFFLGGCSSTHTYVTTDGAKIETSNIGLQTMAVRDQNIVTEKSYNEAMKGASDIQAVALMANKLTQKGQRIEREPTASEEAREWAGLFLRYFGGGVDVLNRRNTKVNSQVYNINGNNNSMNGINNTAMSQSGDVNQSLTNNHTVTTTETNQNWTQNKTTDSANGNTSNEEVAAAPEPIVPVESE